LAALCLVFVLLALPASVERPVMAATSVTTLRDLPAAAQMVVSDALGRDDPTFAVRDTVAGYHIVNPVQELTADFTRAGLRVHSAGASWGLALRAYGYGDALHAVAAVAPRADANRVEYARNDPATGAGPRLLEWYVNGPLGLEQGFVVATAPAGKRAGALTLALSLTGDLSARVNAAGDGLVFLRDGAPTALRYAGLYAFDATGRFLRAWLEFLPAPRTSGAGGEVRIRVDDTGAHYPITIDPFVQQATLSASDAAANDQLGYSVATSADGATIVAGAMGANGGQGAVYVFTKPGSDWASGTQAAKLTATDGAAGDLLGWSVAVSADGSTIVAGTPYANASQGAVYVFARPVGGWVDGAETARLTASDGAAGDQLGWAVGMSGDGATIAAGATGANEYRGAAYVFRLPVGGWAAGAEIAKLTASDGAAYDQLGWSIGVNADGSTIVSGAPYVNAYQGAAYVFGAFLGSWADGNEIAKLTATGGAASDQLGYAVACSADDSTIIAGAPYANSGQGAAYVFVKPGGWATMMSTAKLTASDGVADDHLGWAVASSADGATIVAGANFAAIGGDAGQGAAYLFSRPGGGWADGQEAAKLAASGGVADDRLGHAVAVSADGLTVIASTYRRNAQCGAAYVFGFTAKPGTTTTITADAPEPTVPGQSYTVNFTVVPSAGGGAPTGDVTVSDGAASCTSTVAAGACSLTSTTAGVKTLIADYTGDAVFAASSGDALHTVNKATTALTITADAADPSVVGQSYVVSWTVSVNTPGSGAPTGVVTVTDGANNCSAAVAAGACSLTSTITGTKTLTATYAGDANFTASSDTETHQVNKADTTTAITAHTPDPSVTGEAYTVTWTVTVTAPGAGTPTGAVTVSDGADACSAAVAAGACSLTSTTIGAKTLTATYAGDANFNSSSDTEAHTVKQSSTTMTITADAPDPSVVGQSYVVSWTVMAAAPSTGTPTGAVTVSDGADACSAAVAAGACSLTSTTVGAKTLTATYAGDANFAGSVDTEDHTVQQAATTTTITADAPDPSVVGQSYVVSWTVTANAPSSGAPTGVITVTDGVDSCSAAVAAGGCDLPSTTAGAKTLTATYAGDASFAGSSDTEAHTVHQASTTTTITADAPDPSVVGQSYVVSWTVTVDAPGAGTPTGVITVTDGAHNCSAAVAAGACTLPGNVPSNAPGEKTLVATYGGDANFAASLAAAAHQVNKADTTTTIIADAPDPSVVGQSYVVSWTVTANAPGAGTPTGAVTVSDGADACSAAVAAGACSLTSTTAGAKTLTATYAGDANFNSSSGTEAHTVNQSSTTMTITADAPDPSVVGQSYVVSWTVTVNTPGSGAPTGAVTVSDGTDACSAAVAAGACSLTSTTIGAKTLTATYAGDANFAGSVDTEDHTVHQAATTTTITANAGDPSVVGQSYVVSWTVTANAPGAGTPTGVITVTDGANNCSAAVAVGACSLPAIAPGGLTLTATYSGDANFAGSVGAEAHTVHQANTTTMITAHAPDPSVVGQPYTVTWTVTVNNPGAGTPTGVITVSDGTNQCSAAVAAGACSLPSLAPGGITLTATYAGDANFSGSSDTATHTVNQADTTTTITADAPDPSVVGQPYTVTWTVTVNNPGAGTPTGAVTVTDGANNCSAAAAVGACSLTSTTAGAKTLTATYAGDANFAASSDNTAHRVVWRTFLPWIARP
jgi:hypothetical protein